MTPQASRYHLPDPGEPVIHELPPIRYGGDNVPLRLALRRADDGTWRGRLLFGVGESTETPSTAEILFGVSEEDLWTSIRDLREHHLRDLYRSLVE